MNSSKQIYLLVVLILFTSSLAVWIPDAPAQNIHVLMVIDNGNPKTGLRHDVNKSGIENLMKNSVAAMLAKERPSAAVKISELLSNDSQVTLKNIFGWIQNLNQGIDDVVFVYFSGHGGADKQEAKERYLLLQRSKTYRKEIVKTMQALNCRLKILITEVDSSGSLVTPPADSTDTHAGDDGNKSTDTDTHTPNITQMDCFRQLFLEHEGFLNITSTSLGHMAWGDNLTGGYFTHTFIQGILPYEFSELDRNPHDGFVSWEEVVELTNIYLDARFQMELPRFPKPMKVHLETRNQTTQVSEVLSDFPKPIH